MPPPPARRPPSYRPDPDRPPPDQRRFALTHEEERFADEYLIDLDPRAAAARLSLPPARGAVLLARPRVQDAIAVRRRRRLNRTQVYGDEIVRRWAALAAADPNELAQLRRVNCRHCYGVDHEYQSTDVELRHARAAYQREQLLLAEKIRLAGGDPESDPRLVPFDERGGPGYRRYQPPAPDCPECDGEGLLIAFIRDSRTLSPAGLLLYDGFKTGPGGTIEVKMRDRSEAERQLARHAGLFNEREPIEEFNPDRMSDDQLDVVLHSMIERGVVEIEGEEPSALDPASNDDPDDA